MLLQSIVFTIVSLASVVSAARAGAYVYGCVYFSQAQNDPVLFKFTPGSASDQNIKPAGKANSVNVTDSGITCAYLDLVHEDSSFQDSIWSLGYSGGGYSGFTSSVWSATWWNNKVQLKNQSPKTVVCGSQYLCQTTTLYWDEGTTGPIYFIFTPGATSNLAPSANGGELEL